MFFMGEEVGVSQPYRFDDFLQHRDDFRALREGEGRRLHRFYRDLIHLRLLHPGLRSHNVDIVYAHDGNRLLVFRRWEPPEDFLVVASLNNRGFPDGYAIFSSRIADGAWREVLNSDAPVYGGAGLANGGPVRSSAGTFVPRVPANGVVVFQRQ
jgi:1,4-alpha-glucan branching enzyme